MLIIQFFIGIVAAVAVIAVERKIQKCYERKKFSKAEGTYKGYAVKGSDFRAMEEKPQSEAKITYKGQNRLEIKVTYTNHRIWKGVLVLENEHYGTIGWRYVRMEPNRLEFGFKRCIIEPDGNRILLIDAMYGNEALVRKR